MRKTYHQNFRNPHLAAMQKTAVVSGGTRGIGRAVVTKLLNEGFRVFTCGTTMESTLSLRQLFSGETESGILQTALVDIAVREEIRSWTDSILQETQRIDILVNNAGRFVPGSISTEPEGAFEEMIITNLASAYHLTRALLPALKAAKGHIFNMCSTASITAYPNGGSYGISKFGLLGMSKTLREELKPEGVKVTSILPGATYTDSWAASGLPEDRFMQADDVASILWNAYSLSPSCVLEEVVVRPLMGDI